MSQFRGTINRNGRTPGTPNKVNKEVRELIKQLFENNILALENDFKQLKPNERVQAMLKLATFIVPTLKAVEIDTEPTNRFTPIIIDLSTPNE
jgi:hypothetical protein